jgi:putative spermidine/putrescine transport system ATP-binding protein
VRADKTRLSRQALAEGHTTLPGTVRAVEYQGTYVLLTLQASGATPLEFTAVLPEAEFDAAPWAPGDQAWAHWRADDMHALAA